MEKFIGCMVSLDCGESLGVYQGQVESISPSQGTITLIRSFRNGVPYKLPHVTLRSQDISHLEIIKSSEDVKFAEKNGNFSMKLPENATGNQSTVSVSSVQQQPKIAPVKQLVVLGQNKNEGSIPAFPDISLNSKIPSKNNTLMDAVSWPNKSNMNRNKGFSITPPNNSIKTQKFENDHTSCFQKVSDNSKESEYAKGKDCCRMLSSPQMTPYRAQPGKGWYGEAPIYQNGNGFLKYKDGPKNSFVRSSNSYTEHLYYPQVPYFQKGYENQFSPVHKPSRTAKRNNSECFDHCDGDFDVEFDFEKNLALFDKAAVAQEVKESANSFGNIKQFRNGYYNHQEKYKCDENILKGIELAKRQISLINLSSEAGGGSVMGEYTTDSGLVVPGVAQCVRDKLFSLAERMEFGKDKVADAFGRCISDVILQYLGGSSRFDAKNFHQRPNVVILCCSDNWQSAGALACGRLLSNRMSRVTVYSPSRSAMSSSKEDRTFDAEMKFFQMTGGCTITDPKDLPVSDTVDLILSTIDCQPSAINHLLVGKWAASKKAPVFSIEPSFAGPPLLESKRSFVCGLPPWYVNNVGQVCFCDVGLPEGIYKAAGINYKSPFFDKFSVTLHKSSG